MKNKFKEHQHIISGLFINGLCPYLRRLGDRGFYGTIHTIPMMYLRSRIMWDVNADVDALLKDFCDKSYGKGDDIQWQNTYPLELTKFQRGEKTSRKSQIKLVYHKDKLYFLAEFFKPSDKDELRIQSALKFDQMKGIYAANIDRYWRTLTELRIDKNGKMTRFGNFPSCEFKISEKDNCRTIEGAIPYRNLVNGAPYMPSMRLQFIRYADIWNDYDTAAPTSAGISDYPTWRFLIVDLMPETKVIRDGLE